MHAKYFNRCTVCRSYCSAKTGTLLEGSKDSLRKWAFEIYLECTNLKVVFSMTLHRDIRVTQKIAWFMLHRIREAWAKGGTDADPGFSGPIEVDESFFGGKRKNMSLAKRKELRDAGVGRSPAGKTAVVGAKDRATKRVKAQVVADTVAATLQGFVATVAEPGAHIHTDEATAYSGLPFPHETVKHSIAEYVRDQAHIYGMESFCSMMAREYVGIYDKMSPKHLHHYVAEFDGRQNQRSQKTEDQMGEVAQGLDGNRLRYEVLIATNELASGAQS